MGHYTGEVKTLKCEICRRKTVHQEIMDDGISAGKVVGGFFTVGWSLLLTGIKGKNNKKKYVCRLCGTVNK